MRSMARWRKRWKVVLMNLRATQSSGSASGNGFQSVASTQDYQEGRGHSLKNARLFGKENNLALER